MAESPELRTLVVERFALSQQVAAEVARLEIELLEAIVEGVQRTDEKGRLDETAKAHGGKANPAMSWVERKDDDRPGRYWNWTVAKKSGSIAYFRFWIDVLDGRPAVGLWTQMTTNEPSTAESRRIRAELLEAPGDDSAWLKSGYLTDLVAMREPGQESTAALIDRLVSDTLAASKRHIAFASRCYAKVVEELSKAARPQ